MRIVMDLPGKCIRLPELNAELVFEGEDAFFYLAVMVLISEKAKGRSRGSYIPFADIEDEAWCLSKQKYRPFRSRKSMRINVYQTWLRRLDGDDEECMYEIVCHDEKTPLGMVCQKVKRLFEKEPGKGAETAAYRVGSDPRDVEIIGVLTGRKPLTAGQLFVDALDRGEARSRAEAYLAMLMRLVNPLSQNETMDRSREAIGEMLADDSLWRQDEGGGLVGSLEDYVLAYLRRMGHSVIPVEQMLEYWFWDLLEDPWWIGGAIISPLPPSSPRKFVSSRATFADFARRRGDVMAMLYMFHAAYQAGMVAVGRERFIEGLNSAGAPVRDRVLKAWAKMLGGDNWQAVRDDMRKAFVDLQRLERVHLPYR
jgi:hypothetical protein